MINYTTYTHSTSDQWVTFIHGAGGSSSIWFKQIREFQKHFNVLLLDLRGHGKSNHITFNSRYTFKEVTLDVLEVINHLKITSSHFVGISLGTIIIRQLAELQPQRVKSMVMGGAILKMNIRSQILMGLGNTFKYVLPYMFLYKLFAFVIMPNKNHRNSRLLFVREAKKLCQKEFIKWFRLTSEIHPVLKWFRQIELNIPTLYIMGDEDHMFLPSVEQVVKAHTKSSRLHVIENCGHVVNVDEPQQFNHASIDFLKSIG